MEEDHQQELSLSIEETNKLRAKLGLKPLSTGVDSQTKTAEDNFADYKARLEQEQKSQVLKDRLEKAKLKRLREQKLTGHTLAEEDVDDLDDTEAWILRSRARQGAIQKQLQQKQRLEAEQLAKERSVEYGSKQLSGLVVGHEVDDLAEDEEHVLVLRDSNVLDDYEDGDELVSLAVADKEKTKQYQEAKKLRAAHEAYENQSTSILSQYDEEIIGPPKRKFQLTGGDILVDDLKRQQQKLTDRVFESLDDIKQDVQQDYMTPEEVPVAFKKSKKKKSSKSKRQMSSLDESLELPADHASQDDFMRAAERAEASRIRKKQNFVDDDDLQAALASSRKSVIKKKTAQDIAKELEESRIEEDGLAPVGLVLSETTEFVRNLSTVSQTQLALKDKMQLNLKEELPTVNEEIEAEEEEGTMDMDFEETGHVSDDQGKEDEGEKLVQAITEEPLVAQGMAATLSLLKQKGLVQPLTEEERKQDKLILQKQKWLMKKKLEEEAAGQQPSASRRKEDERLERERMKEVQERFKDYKPQITLEYKDDSGRILNTKEAFRFMAHKFHGIKPGKNKREKLLRRQAEEARLTEFVNSDRTVGIAETFMKLQESTGTSHLVLSVGHKNTAPTRLHEHNKIKSVSTTKQTTAEEPNETLSAPYQDTQPAVEEPPIIEYSSEFRPTIVPIQDQSESKPRAVPIAPIGSFTTTMHPAMAPQGPAEELLGGRQKIQFGLAAGKRKQEENAASANKRWK